MSFEEIILNAKRLVSRDIKETLGFIIPLINPNSDKFDDFINIEGRYNYVKGEEIRGTINSEEKNLNYNQIRTSILSLIGQLTKEEIELFKETINHNPKERLILEKLRKSIEELEKLKTENAMLKSQVIKKPKIKVIVQCEPRMNSHPNDYSCHCVILDDDTGERIEKQIPLQREQGGIIARIYNINPRNLIQLKIEGNEKVWESDYFCPEFYPQTLKLM